LKQQLSSASEEQSNVLVGILDVVRFGSINETLGKHGGDAVLAFVANRLRSVFPEHSNIARVGGDSFAMAVSGRWGAGDSAHAYETYYSACFGEPFVIDGEELHVSATVGLAIYPGDGSKSDLLFTNAEAALMKAKRSNSKLLFYSPDMNASVAESLRLETKLRRAIDNQELVLWYQPKVNVKTRKITGFEALMRWQDPETGMVPPGRFIPLMEQTGLILDAGRWALSQVARDCESWAKDGSKPPRVAVNASPLQLRQEDFVTIVREAAHMIEEAGSALDLEITESVIMENVEAIIPKLQTMRGLGVRVAVDDFGTGYSSLAYVARLPIHALKIDRSFIVGITTNQDSLAITKAIISLAHSLRLKVVAEGVETEQQAALLVQLDCDEMQGYLISRPMPPNEIASFLGG
jgi:diguanylate cyclase (GGDEF)-like protein